MTSETSSPETETPAADHKTTHKAARWHEHIPRTTAALAVLAAVSSGQYTGQFSRTILAQAEVTDEWSYYQAKSIKKHLTQNQADLAHELGVGKPEMASQLADFEQKNLALVKKYDAELASITAKAKTLESEKTKHTEQGDRFQLAFVILQAGVVLSTVAASAKRKELWFFAIFCGVLGLVMVADAYLLVDLKLRPPPPEVTVSAASANN
jgi:hypothetical protein